MRLAATWDHHIWSRATRQSISDEPALAAHMESASSLELSGLNMPLTAILARELCSCDMASDIEFRLET